MTLDRTQRELCIFTDSFQNGLLELENRQTTYRPADLEPEMCPTGSAVERRVLVRGKVGWSVQGASATKTARAPLPPPPISLRPLCEADHSFFELLLLYISNPWARVRCMVLDISKPPRPLYDDVIRRLCLLLRTYLPLRECVAAVPALPYIQ